MNVRVAMVQPRAVWGEEEWRNAAQAVKIAEEAADNGAELITFPEGYPGPSHGPMDSAGMLEETPNSSCPSWPVLRCSWAPNSSLPR